MGRRLGLARLERVMENLKRELDLGAGAAIGWCSRASGPSAYPPCELGKLIGYRALFLVEFVGVAVIRAQPLHPARQLCQGVTRCRLGLAFTVLHGARPPSRAMPENRPAPAVPLHATAVAFCSGTRKTDHPFSQQIAPRVDQWAVASFLCAAIQTTH